LKKTCDRHETLLSFFSCSACFIDSLAVLSASEGCGVLNCPLGEGERGAAQNLLHGVRRRSGLLDEAGPVAEQSVGDVLGKALGEHGLANLLRRDLLPTDLLADKANPVALGEGLRAGEHVGVPSVAGGAPRFPAGAARCRMAGRI
jgi:hypothetical protein